MGPWGVGHMADASVVVVVAAVVAVVAVVVVVVVARGTTEEIPWGFGCGRNRATRRRGGGLSTVDNPLDVNGRNPLE